MNEIKYFKEFNIEAGFTCKPNEAVAAREGKIGTCDLVVRAKLVHGTDVCIVDKDALSQKPYLEVDECDGLITDIPGVMLTTTHGDCIPVYAYDPVKKVIGLCHAGWRGTADCIVSNMIYWMQEEYHCKAKDIHAVIGAGIGMCCFEVDDDVVDYFTEGMPWTEEYMLKKPSGKYAVDLKGINCELLEIEGVLAENIFIDDSCTCCKENENRFWSYRRAKDKERMLAYIKK